MFISYFTYNDPKILASSSVAVENQKDIDDDINDDIDELSYQVWKQVEKEWSDGNTDFFGVFSKENSLEELNKKMLEELNEKILKDLNKNNLTSFAYDRKEESHEEIDYNALIDHYKELEKNSLRILNKGILPKNCLNEEHTKKDN